MTSTPGWLMGHERNVRIGCRELPTDLDQMIAQTADSDCPSLTVVAPWYLPQQDKQSTANNTVADF
jgi:hypothetical protein